MVAFSTFQQLKYDGLNPNNLALKLPEKHYGLDLRPEWLIQYERLSRLTLRPSFYLEQKEWSYNEALPREKSARVRPDLIDAFVEIASTPTTKWSIGLQNLQWGPADLLNVSNPLSHARNRVRHILAREKGRVQARVSYTPSLQTNWSLTSELSAVPELDIQAEQKFSPTSFLRWERFSTAGTSYLGMSAGVEAPNRPFVGPYFSWMLVEGFSFYTDMRFTQRSRYFRPSMTTFNMEFVEKGTPASQGLVGFRWEGLLDFRVEAYHHADGYSKEEYEQALYLIQLPLSTQSQNFERFAKSGLEFLGKNIGLVSLRYPQLFGWSDVTWNYRHLRSLMDDSRVHSSGLEFPLGANAQGVVQVQLPEGRKEHELSSLTSSQYEVHLKATF